MRYIFLSAILALSACGTAGPRREPCFLPPAPDDSPLAATTAETLSERELRRSRNQDVAATQAVEVADCVAPVAPAPVERPLDDREREPARLEPLIKK